jgi:hypothetical protein
MIKAIRTRAQLWINIANNCHSIVLNDYLRQGYYETAGRVREKGLGFMKILTHVTKTLGKTEYTSYLPNPHGASKFLSDDAPIGLLAVQSRAVPVTSDSRLRTALQSVSAAETKSLMVLTPQRAVPFLLIDSMSTKTPMI